MAVALRNVRCCCQWGNDLAAAQVDFKDAFHGDVPEGTFWVDLNSNCIRHAKILQYLIDNKHYTKCSVEILRELEYRELAGDLFPQPVFILKKSKNPYNRLRFINHDRGV
jgi:hypothetical protein